MKNGCVQMFAKRCAHCRIKDECCPLYFRVMKVSGQHLFFVSLLERYQTVDKQAVYLYFIKRVKRKLELWRLCVFYFIFASVYAAYVGN